MVVLVAKTRKQKSKKNSRIDSEPARKTRKQSEAWFWLFILALIVIAGLVYYYPGTWPFEPAQTTGQVIEKQAGEMEEKKMQAAPVEVDMQFVNHLQAGFPEQDVFVESPVDTGVVVRVESEAADDPALLGSLLYTAAAPVEHDPFKVGNEPLGPYEKGDALGFTLGEWLAAEGAGKYTVEGEKAEIKASFKNLVPDGVYTVWCSSVTFPPNMNIVDRPCGAQDGSENSFRADSEGSADFILEIEPLGPSTKETASVIALAYHSDGRTYGPNPGDFGLTSHVHIFFIIPELQETAPELNEVPIPVEPSGGPA